MSYLQLVVCFEQQVDGFARDQSYRVLEVQNQKFLIVDDEARFVWVDPMLATPVSVSIGGEPVFDLETHRKRRQLESLSGKAVVLTTWENLGFEPDSINAEQMLVYRGVVDSYDGQTLFLHRQDEDAGRFGVLPKAIATIEEDREG